MRTVAGGGALGARIEGLDLARPLGLAEFRAVIGALGRHGVLCFPGQDLTPAQLAGFGAQIGPLERNVASAGRHAPGHPEVMFISNIRANGQPIGLVDAGQDWHTDLSYCSEIALATILHAREVPMRDGRSLGATQFRNMHAAYDELPQDLKTRLDGKRAVHDFNKFWDMMVQRPGSVRAPLSVEQRAARPPVPQPIFRTHPITGRSVLYCNPGYATRIEDVSAAESDELLALLFAHQAQDKFTHAHRWTVGDVLMWDDIGTTHNAVGDYGPADRRLMYRVQAMAARDYRSLAA